MAIAVIAVVSEARGANRSTRVKALTRIGPIPSPASRAPSTSSGNESRVPAISSAPATSITPPIGSRGQTGPGSRPVSSEATPLPTPTTAYTGPVRPACPTASKCAARPVCRLPKPTPTAPAASSGASITRHGIGPRPLCPARADVGSRSRNSANAP